MADGKVYAGSVLAFDIGKNIMYTTRRSEKVFVDASGVQKLAERFSMILARAVQIYRLINPPRFPPECSSAGNEVFRRPDLRMTSLTKSGASSLTVILRAYRGNSAETPTWIDEDPENFTEVCRVDADVSHLPMTAKRNRDNDGKIYYQKPAGFDCTSIWVH
ncbi:hypothetical protein M413DRAFT_13178 [Hebeloma cylindrosporum]|uniref:Uncharacterized protein n=1 Tax=Hebeloma cylindrosporum TaxID=76867 RepID=A0A0C3C0D9_HEBCY|nr:hypothetical protein M413DRAFT_13178 [Hebeloma cylindrosporum h7]